MKSLRIISQIVHSEDISKKRGFICVDIKKGMRTYEEGFKILEPIREIYSQKELKKKIELKQIEVVNGQIDDTTGEIIVVNNLKGKDIYITDTFKSLNGVVTQIMLVGKIVYPDGEVYYRVVDGFGCIDEVKYNSLVSMIVKRTRVVVNCKVTKKANKYIISCLRGELPLRIL